jgi:hypothetical protein
MTFTGGFTPSTSAFGVERRSPRGAFLWPAAAVAALGLDAPSPDGNLGMTVAALELLAAQAVAELGTYAANVGGFGPAARGGAAGMTDDGEPTGFGNIAMPTLAGSLAASAPGTSSFVAPSSSSSTPSSSSTSFGTAQSSGGQPVGADSEAAVLETITTLVPSSRRARFDALYVALGQSVQSREWSPAARAARALALVGRGDVDTAQLSAIERAATVWDVLPVVYALGERGPDGVTPAARGGQSTGTTGTSSFSMPTLAGGGRATGGTQGSAASRAPNQSFVSGQPDFQIDGRPGLGSLSSRAGEALGSYVTAHAASSMMPTSSSGSSSGGSSSSNLGAMHRVPTAAPELVRTGGRPSARAGGGETEIPAWFEAAARKMFSDGQGQGMGSDISLADLTLIQAAPPSQIAASTRGNSAPTPSPSDSPAAALVSGADLDVEKIAYEVYRTIIDMMDHARARNGESFL